MKKLTTNIDANTPTEYQPLVELDHELRCSYEDSFSEDRKKESEAANRHVEEILTNAGFVKSWHDPKEWVGPKTKALIWSDEIPGQKKMTLGVEIQQNKRAASEYKLACEWASAKSQNPTLTANEFFANRKEQSNE